MAIVEDCRRCDFRLAGRWDDGRQFRNDANLRARIQSVTALRQPLDLTLEGTYSPQEVFFRTFKLANDRISLGAFVLLGSNFVEIRRSI